MIPAKDDRVDVWSDPGETGAARLCDDRARFLDLFEIPNTPSYTVPLRVLFLADDRHTAIVVQDHLRAIALRSHHRITVANPIHDAVELAGIADVDVILIHYSIFVLSDYFFPPTWREAIASFPGAKVQIIQDEYRHIERMKRCMAELGIRAVMSSLSVDNLPQVYGGPLLSNTIFVSCLPGYVSELMLELVPPPIAQRPLDVVYRGRQLPYKLGRLAREKELIGDQMGAIAARFGLSVDIDSREQQRVYGPAWHDFLMSGRATLGVEGGASIFDFHDDIEPAIDAYHAAHPRAGFEEIFAAVLERYEGNVVHKTITPKIFEAIAARTALILYPGRFRDVLVPDRHFITLEPDGSNATEVVSKLRDIDYLQELVDRTHGDIIRQPYLHMDHYVRQLDAVLTNTWRAVTKVARTTESISNPTSRAPVVSRQFRRRPRICVLAASSIDQLPTRKWCDAFAAAGWEIIAIGFNHSRRPRLLPKWLACAARFGVVDFHYLLAKLPGMNEVTRDATRVKADLWLATDWRVLPLAADRAVQTAAILGYDCRWSAFDPDVRTQAWKLLYRPIVEKIERGLASRLKIAVVSSESAANEWLTRYQPDGGLFVIRNVSWLANIAVRRTGMPIRVLLDGVITSRPEAETVLASVPSWRDEFQLTIRGPLSEKDCGHLRSLASRWRVNHRVDLVSSTDEANYAADAATYDIGLFVTLAATNRWALPAELFGYLMSNLAVCAVASEETCRVIETLAVGDIIPSCDPQLISDTINKMSAARIDAKKRNARIATLALNWEREAQAFVEACSRTVQSARNEL